MTEIASLLAAALSDLGYPTVFPAEGLPAAGRDRVNLVVAPHEFFPLQQGIPEDDLLRAAELSVTVGVEQPGTLWFDLGARYSSVAAGVLDISQVAVAELRRRGVAARHLQLGYHPSWDRWGGRDTRPRSKDVLFLGSITERRDRCLSSMAPLLWDCETDIRLFEFPRPMTETRGHFVAGEDKWRLLADSRILLNIHRNEVPYFEWVRVLEAVANGCLVITESSDEYGHLVPGQHLIAAPADSLGSYAASLVLDEELRAGMAGAAYDLLRTQLEMTSLLAPICEELPSGPPATAGKSVPLPLPAPQIAPPPTQPLIEEVIASEHRIRARVKELIDSETALIRRVEAMQTHISRGDPDFARVTTTPAWKAFEPDVTVLLTTYNSEGFVTDAISSVFDTSGLAVDLVIVDDHSADRTTAVIENLMRGFPSFPVKLIAREANGGVSVARNRALEDARGRFVFVLDADNWVFPNAISRLTAALEAEPDAAFAYGLVAKTGGEGMLSYLPWDLVRMCESNYVDAMALIRRSAFEEAGGYDAHFGLVGWEDYELWLRFAAAGWHPVFIPAFIGSYSVRPGSRQETVNLDDQVLRAELRNLFPYFPWP